MTDAIEVTDVPPVLPSEATECQRLRELHAQAAAEAAHWLTEFKRLQAVNEGLVGRLGAIAEAFHRCVNKMGVRCPACGLAYDVMEAATP